MNRSTDLHKTIGLAYEAALSPGRWPEVLESAADVLHADSAALHSQNQITGKGWGITARLDPAAEQPYFGYFAARNPIRHARNRLLRLFDDSNRWQSHVVNDEHALPKRELTRSEYYNDFLRHFGIHSVLSVGLALQGEKYSTINFLRPQRRDQFDTAEMDLAVRLQPHLIRAFELGFKLSEAQQLNASLARSLDCSPHAIFLVDAGARARHVNRAAEWLVSQARGLSLKEGILRATTSDATRALHRMVNSAAAADPDRRCGGAMAVHRPGIQRPLSVIVAPLGSESVSFARASPTVIVCVSDPESGVVVPEKRLRALFGLTPAEARIAIDLLAGCDPAAIADRKSLSVNTVRVHIAHIMAKTETNRQAELVRLLERVSGICVD